MKYAAQYYTLRDLTKTAEGLRESLAKVSQMGYQGIQVSAIECLEKEVSPQQLKGWLDEEGLACAATHRSWDSLRDHTEAEIEFHQILGCDYVAVGGAPTYCYEDGAEGWRKWIAELPLIIDKLARFNIDFAFHNHHTEFEWKDGSRGFDLLMTEADQRLQFELDTYWVVHAGLNLERLISKLNNRLDVVHLKDKEVNRDRGWETFFAPVGEGNLEWASIIPALKKAGTKWGIVEQDSTYGRDPFDCLESSMRYLIALENEG
jgi:sugar phosphate isomerase/epimerase